ncbi:MAG: peptidylprolyl isomerase [Planctomycetia bacterium]|nr:peptidylprolyl isomerase [Planctomycetia bacterium]
MPRVLLKTNEGDIVLELFENEAPQTVGNFINLVEKGFYTNLPFHRVLHGFMAQGGDPKGDGTGGPGYDILCECYKDNHRLHFRGALSMAHSGKDTGGSQFFITFVPTAQLDGPAVNPKNTGTPHTVFGRVVSGFDVLAKLQKREPPNSMHSFGPKAPLPVPDKIVEAKVLNKRNHPYEPTKVATPKVPGAVP